jgi:hypothetical protein
MVPVTTRLADTDAERVRRSHAGCILELQSVPVVGGMLQRNVVLPEGENVAIAHGLGRPAAAWTSAPRGSSSGDPGRIREIRDPSFDPEKFCVLKANDWGETVTVDVWIF